MAPPSPAPPTGRAAQEEPIITTELIKRSDVAGGAILTLDSPTNRNALSRPLVSQLQDHLDRVAADAQARAVVITATGSTFCAGADLSDPPVSEGPGSFTGVLRTLVDYPKPVIVAVNGHVRAGGFGLVAAADIVVCDERASFAFTEVRIGVAPAIISVLCVRRMPELAARRYMLTGETFDAAEAARVGLVTSVVDAGTTADAAQEFLAGFRLCEPGALRVTRALLPEVAGLDVASGLTRAQKVSEELFGSPQAAEGIAAFKEKRLPVWASQTEEDRP